MNRRVSHWLRRLARAHPEQATGIGRTFVLSSIVGIAAGLGAVALVSLLQLTTWAFLGQLGGYSPGAPGGEPIMFRNLPAVAGGTRRWVLLVLPMLGALVSAWIVRRFAPEAEGHGTDAAIEAYHFHGGKIRGIVPPVKAVATSLLIGTGGSAGCEGPISQIGAGMGAWLGHALRLPVPQRRVLMAAGMGAGVGALFHAPLAGALFAAEVLYRELDLEYEVLISSVIASVTSYAVFSKIFGFKPLFETPLNGFAAPETLPLYVLLALCLVLGARFYTWSFYAVHDRFAALAMPRVLKPALGGLMTGIIGFFFLPVLGGGYGILQEALRHGTQMGPDEARSVFLLLIGVFVLKTVSTSFSVGSGGSGGLFGPALVVGGALGGAVGVLLSQLLPGWNLSVGSFTLVGMVAFLGCVAKTPLCSILMVSEMTGNYRLLVPCMWACMIAYMLSRKVVLYRSQLPTRFEAPVHRGQMISGVLNTLTVDDLLPLRPRAKAFRTVSSETRLVELLERIAHDGQRIFPVVTAAGVLSGVVTEAELTDVATSDPMLQQTLLVDDLNLRPHAVVTRRDTLKTVLGHLDTEDVDGLVVVTTDEPPVVEGIVTHADVAAAYRREIHTIR